MLHTLLLSLVATAIWPGTALPLPHDPEGRLAEVSAKIARAPFATEFLIERAEIYEQLGSVALALLDCERAAMLEPWSAAIELRRGRLLYLSGRGPEALLCVEHAIALGVDDVRARWLRGQVLAAAGRHSEALAEFEAQLGRWSPARPEHYLELAETAAAAGSTAAQRAALDRGIAELGPAPALVRAAIECDLAIGAVDSALARIDAILAHAAVATPWQLLAADVLERGGRAAEANQLRASIQGSTNLSPAVLPSGPSSSASVGAVPPGFVAPVTLVPANAIWRYKDDNSITGTSWRTPAFADGSWLSGRAQLGYGDGDEATVVGFGPSSTNRYITTWFRHTFTVPLGAPYTAAVLRLLRDDGAVVYLDGQEIVRSNMPTGTIAPSTLASAAVNGTAESAFNSFSIEPTRLRPGPHTFAVEVHQSAANSTDISFALELTASRGAAFVTRWPYVQNATADGAVLRWRTETPTTTSVWVGNSPTTLQLAHADARIGTEHAVELRGLQPETRYYFACGDIGGVLVGGDSRHFFTTLPPIGAVRPCRIWALGDCGTGLPAAYAVRDRYREFAQGHPADMILLLGDNAYNSGLDTEYQTGLFDVYRDDFANTPMWATLGNHDAGNASSSSQTGPYYQNFDLPKNGEAGGLPSGTEAYYSFDRGHIHFICLDSQDTSRLATGAMMQWLQADLASTQAPWVIAFFHHPPYTKGTHDSDNTGDSGARMTDMRQVALPILEQFGVDLVLAGHSHTYERSFLLDGHYGVSTTFAAAMLVDRGDGRVDGDGSYAKAAAGRGSHDGAVYVVAGSAGHGGSGPLNHPAMFVSMSNAGSLVVDVDGNRLDATFVTDTGAQPDHFTIEKNLQRSLRRDLPALSLAGGGRQQFTLQAGPAFANKSYALAGSFGTDPGFTLGALHVPLNQDSWWQQSMALANSSTYPGSVGVLDQNGAASAAIVVAPGALAALAGQSLYHAYVVLDAGVPVMVSNVVRLRLQP